MLKAGGAPGDEDAEHPTTINCIFVSSNRNSKAVMMVLILVPHQPGDNHHKS
jgi:hypothetical protein